MTLAENVGHWREIDQMDAALVPRHVPIVRVPEDAGLSVAVMTLLQMRRGQVENGREGQWLHYLPDHYLLHLLRLCLGRRCLAKVLGQALASTRNTRLKGAYGTIAKCGSLFIRKAAGTHQDQRFTRLRI